MSKDYGETYLTVSGDYHAQDERDGGYTLGAAPRRVNRGTGTVWIVTYPNGTVYCYPTKDKAKIAAAKYFGGTGKVSFI